MSIQLFIFDIAGTTVRDDGFVHRAFMATAEEIGIRPDDAWVRSKMGVHKRQVLEELLRMNERSTTDAPELAHRFEQHIALQLRHSPPQPLPSTRECFDKLDAAGIRIGFNTGFSAATTQPLLAALGWAERTWVSSDQVARGRPAPDLILEAMRRAGVSDSRQVGVAGDTPSDLLAGTAAGCRLVIGVGHGTHSLEQLAPHPHTHLLPDLSRIPELAHGAV